MDERSGGATGKIAGGNWHRDINMTAKAIKTAVKTCKTKVQLVPQPMTSGPIIRFDLPEWLVPSPHCNTDSHALVAFSSLRVHAAKKPDIQDAFTAAVRCVCTTQKLADTRSVRFLRAALSISHLQRMSAIRPWCRNLHGAASVTIGPKPQLSDHRTVGAHVGTSQLRGYW
jgi:hypothetical protein